MLELHFIYKPVVIYNRLRISLGLLPGWWQCYVVGIACLAGAISFASALAGRFSVKPVLLSAGALLSLLLMSTLPHLFAYPVYMAETLWLLLAFIAFGACSSV